MRQVASLVTILTVPRYWDYSRRDISRASVQPLSDIAESKPVSFLCFSSVLVWQNSTTILEQGISSLVWSLVPKNDGVYEKLLSDIEMSQFSKTDKYLVKGFSEILYMGLSLSIYSRCEA